MSDIIDLSNRSVTDLIAWGKSAIEQAGSFEQLREIVAAADALKAYRLSIGCADDAVDAAREIKARAERRMGSELSKLEKARGGQPSVQNSYPGDRGSAPVTLKDVGISYVQSSRWQKLAEVPDAVFDETIEAIRDEGGEISGSAIARVAEVVGDISELPVIEQRRAVRDALSFPDEKAAMAWAKGKKTERAEQKRDVRTARERDLAEATRAASAQVGSQVYGVIYADPPWRFEPYSRETGMDRAADNHYPTEGTDVICAMIPPSADSAVLFLWATSPMLPDGLRVMAEWGFTYKSQVIWVKDRIGTGYWARNKHEILLIGTRGNVPAPSPGTQFCSVVEASLGRHSEKPAIFAELIESMFPSLPKLEMFCRAPRHGWDVWGNQASEAVA